MASGGDRQLIPSLDSLSRLLSCASSAPPAPFSKAGRGRGEDHLAAAFPSAWVFLYCASCAITLSRRTLG